MVPANNGSSCVGAEFMETLAAWSSSHRSIKCKRPNPGLRYMGLNVQGTRIVIQLMKSI